MVDQDPRVGMVLHDRYRLVERLTAGTMGVVYRGERIGLGRTVAVKFLHESFAATEDGVRRFEVEARAMSRLSHPNCVGVIDFGMADGAPYLVMDFVTGRTLREVIRDEVRLPPKRAVHIARQIVAGLSHAHANGIIHRDMKPENVVVSEMEGRGEQARILDFGLAKLRDAKSVTTGVALGTPGYMSPEQTIGRKVDNRADVYAVGIILYELIVGRKPFQAPDVFEVMRMHREDPVPKPSQLALKVRFSSRLDAVIERALAKDPDDRFASMDELGAALDETPEAGHGGVSRRGAILIGLGASAAAAVVAIALWPTGGNDDDSGTQPTAERGASETERGPSRAGGGGGERGKTPPPAAADAAVAEPAPIDAASGADVEELLERAAAGESDEALRELEALRVREPRRGDVYYALGNLYTEQLNWEAAVSAYSTAILLESAYGEDERLIADAVEALANNQAHEVAARMLTAQIGARALPRLDAATRSSNPKLRDRAKKVREKIVSDAPDDGGE